MFRASSAADSIFVDVVATPGNGVSMQWRDSTGGLAESDVISSVPGPGGLQARSGSNWLPCSTTCTGYYSTDGNTWNQIGSISVSLGNGNSLAGLCVTAQDQGSGLLDAAAFTNLAIVAPLANVAGLPVSAAEASSTGTVTVATFMAPGLAPTRGAGCLQRRHRLG